MDDIRERDLSSKPNHALSDEEKRELSRRFKEFSEMVKARGPRACGLRGAGKGDGTVGRKRIRKWMPSKTA
ncbi:hypothetical protein CKO28_22425 [Rhodovibrio sodomensis]|uniref:Histone H1 n=1 Tax=Rhodovibrio sodomensis TaxID=1088 RepID=A0ABS1DLG2_9PROT|nr:hypothetical protein [Rhodovibrio sodomensis]MBK1670777.1 hypothetical protein [Rhodovibrio sodomensis]